MASGTATGSRVPRRSRTRPCRRWPRGSSRRPIPTSNCGRWLGPWPRRSGCRTCGWRSSGRSGQLAIVEHGRQSGQTIALPVGYRGASVGRLVVCPGDGTALSERDQRLLGDLVRQAAAAARASELSTELQRGRSRLVAAREEERRRIRRDLHDSLGPSLGAVALRIETARNLAGSAPEKSDAMLEQATDRGGCRAWPTSAGSCMTCGRLRSTSSDWCGRSSSRPSGSASAGLPGLRRGGSPGALPAGVEVAAYRIASEALTNVARHARLPRRCDITLRWRTVPRWR